MDAKLTLVLIFTTIVVVTGSPLRADIAARPPWASSMEADIAARPPWAEAQLRSRGDCNYVTLKDGRRFCVRLAVTSKEYIKDNN